MYQIFFIHVFINGYFGSYHILATMNTGMQLFFWTTDFLDYMLLSVIAGSHWWWTGKPGMLQSMGSQRVGYDWVTELITIFRFLKEPLYCFPWKESYYQPRQHIKKQRHPFADKGPFSQNYGFSSIHVWMWELSVKKAERWRTDAFQLYCWRRLLRVPWTAKRSN